MTATEIRSAVWKKRRFCKGTVGRISPFRAHRRNTWCIPVQSLDFSIFFQEQKELVDPYLTFNFAGRKVSVCLYLQLEVQPGKTRLLRYLFFK